MVLRCKSLHINSPSNFRAYINMFTLNRRLLVMHVVYVHEVLFYVLSVTLLVHNRSWFNARANVEQIRWFILANK